MQSPRSPDLPPEFLSALAGCRAVMVNREFLKLRIGFALAHPHNCIPSTQNRWLLSAGAACSIQFLFAGRTASPASRPLRVRQLVFSAGSRRLGERSAEPVELLVFDSVIGKDRQSRHWLRSKLHRRLRNRRFVLLLRKVKHFNQWRRFFLVESRMRVCRRQ